MKTFKIADDDLVIVSGNLQMIEGKDEIVQAVERTLTTRLGEFFLDTSHGFDYETVQKKGYSEEEIKDAVREAVLQDDRIISVDSVDVTVDRSSRSVNIRFTATGDETIEGEVTV